MWINTLWHRWYGRSRPLPSSLQWRRSARQRSSFRPRLEALEDRTLLTAYSAVTIGDLVTDIGLANQNGGSNTITLTAATSSTYTLTAALPTIAYSGSGKGSDKLTIIGNGDTIDGNNQYRLFDVAGGNSLTLENLTLQHGLAKGTGAAAEGGAIYSSGTLVLTQANLTDNKAQGKKGDKGNKSSGGANGSGGSNAYGGGVYVAAGAVTLSSDTLSDNTAQAGKGGNGQSGVASAPGGKGGGGGVAYGGGLYVAAGTVTLRSASLKGNAARGGAGGNGGTGGTRRSPDGITGAGGDAGAGNNAYGGGLYVAAGAVTLNNDTLSSNSAQGGAGGNGGIGGPTVSGGGGGVAYGGGLYVAAGTVTLANDLLIRNTGVGGSGGTGSTGYAGSGGTGADGSGGGLDMAGGSVHFVNDTLAYNQATGGAGGGYVGGGNGSPGIPGSGVGGGMNISGGAAYLANTLIAGNTATGGTPVGPDVDGTVTSSDRDLIDNTAGSGGLGKTGSGDIINVAAGSNSNGTLLGNSPGIDAGDDNVSPGAVDLLGYARIVSNAIDIGAYEYGATKATTNLSVSSQAAYGTTPGGDIVYHLTVINNSSIAQSNVTLADVLPANTTLVSWTPAIGAWFQSKWSHHAPTAGDCGIVTAWIASLAGKSSAAFTLIVRVNSHTPVGTIITDTASVGPITGDPKPGNNSTTFHTTITAGTVISSGIQVSGGNINHDSRTGLWVQKVTITNTSEYFGWIGSLALELTGLLSSVTLANANGITPNGDPYIDFVAPRGTLAPGQSITLTLEFAAPTATSIKGYGTQVVQGW